ncbi:hypothetical protein MKZ38_007887 [Zalerion maritima]|uniref:Bromodomain associated domain-containing protein n=1 Tax=Zalerion maritima TaxID=339359 RepID=A0AAD5RI62_9PEZI|nr:hypothetical protein MKZ38_007887 [Zalerion maritima]
MASPQLVVSSSQPLTHTQPQPPTHLQLKTATTSTTANTANPISSPPAVSPASASTPAVAAAVVSELPTATSVSPAPPTSANGLASPPATMPTATSDIVMNNRKRTTPSSPSDDGNDARDAKRQRTVDSSTEEVQQRTPESHDGSRTPETRPGAAEDDTSTSPNGVRINQDPSPGRVAALKRKAREDMRCEEEEWQRQRPRFADLYPKTDEPARAGLQKCLALVLHHVGFHGASPEAMEHFTNMSEDFLAKYARTVKQAAAAARRSVPAPVDFEFALPEFNIAPWQLKKHLKPPARLPDIPFPDDLLEKHFPSTAQPDLPVFDLLSGDKDRQDKPHIPAHFPAFPSIHTFKYTPTDARFAAAVAKGEEVDESREAAEARKRKQEQTVVEAKQSEDTLRGFLNATKKRTQKEMSTKALGGKDTGAKNRFIALENALSAFGGSRA